jgi:antitoxin component YwqK of YwqJK toxin-antitoxin module
MIRLYSLCAFILFLSACAQDEDKKSTHSQEFQFSIKGAIERVDSTYADGGHRVSTFFDEKTNERIAYVKFHPSGHPYTDVRFKNNKRNGTSYSYHKNGQLWSVNTYKDDVYHGVWKIFHPNGKPRLEGNYVDGLEEGEWFYYHDNGQLDTRGFYKLGKKVGIWTSYDVSGKLIKEINHDNP